MRRARVVRASFVDADLCEANLSEADLTKANFSGANLEGAILSNAKLKNLILTGARLFSVDLSGARNLDSISAEWIDVGEKGNPMILTGDELEEWLKNPSKLVGANRDSRHWFAKPALAAN